MPEVLDPYASHIPVLKAVAGLIKPKRVLEFGAGFHSTPFFLGLPSLKELVSVEVDAKWRRRVKRECADHRLRLTTKPPQPDDFDLVFIDDGKIAAERVVTICWVLGRPHPPVVIHDADVPEYAAAIRMAGAPGPTTAVVW